jgi:GT2 family glycosyltransferase
MQVSIIIVNYNTRELLCNCLQSIYQQVKDIEFEVIVSDNGSTDNSIGMIKSQFPKVILIENKKNLGFGKANNKGLNIALGKYIFYLNSDTILLNNAVKIFYDFWENHHNKQALGVIGCILLDSKLERMHSYADLPVATHELNQKFLKEPGENKKHNYNKPFEVGYVTGADMFLKNDVFARFDERFFLFYEESDLQFQLKKAGKKSLIIPGPKIIHLKGASDQTNNIPLREISFSYIHFALSRIKYLRKNDNKRVILFILKSITFIKWINPFLLHSTSKYIFQLLRI